MLRPFNISNENIFENNNIYVVEHQVDEDEAHFVNGECTEEVPYSSSSLDRSSIGSIPWTDDAIKQNQIAWEQVERMLKGEEVLPDEQELRNEIQEWQNKFPKLLSNWNSDNSAKPFKDSFNDSILKLSLESLNDDSEEDENDEFQTLTPTNKKYNKQSLPTQNKSKLNIKDLPNLTALFERSLRITSVPLSLRQRKKQLAHNFEQTGTISSTPLPSTPSSRKQSYSTLVIRSPLDRNMNKWPANKYQMPPILNAVESRRRLRGVPNNRSFVQLTHVQQVQSAAVTYHPQRRVERNKNSIWQLPLTATSLKGTFANNHNSIVLPAIVNAPQQAVTDKVIMSGGNKNRIHSLYDSTTSANTSERGIIIGGIRIGARNGWQKSNFIPRWSFNGDSSSFTQSSTSPSTGGRSISAADLSGVYLPFHGVAKFN